MMLRLHVPRPVKCAARPALSVSGLAPRRLHVLTAATRDARSQHRSPSQPQRVGIRCFSGPSGPGGGGGGGGADHRRGTVAAGSPPATRATRQHENIYTLPNLLTVSRLVAAPAIGYCVLHEQHWWALGLFAWAGVSDLLDGWIARRWGLGTVVGTVIDPMADKILMTVLAVSLAVKGALPVWLAVIILGRDVGLGIAAVYYRWISLPPPKTFSRYWDFSLPSAEVRPTTISKYNTFLQLALVGLTMVAPVAPVDLASSLAVMQYVVAATTVWSGASYVFSKDAVRIIGESKSKSGR